MRVCGSRGGGWCVCGECVCVAAVCVCGCRGGGCCVCGPGCEESELTAGAKDTAEGGTASSDDLKTS